MFTLHRNSAPAFTNNSLTYAREKAVTVGRFTPRFENCSLRRQRSSRRDHTTARIKAIKLSLLHARRRKKARTCCRNQGRPRSPPPPRTPAPCLLRPSPAALRTSGTTPEAGGTRRHPRRPAGGLPPGVSTGSTPEAAGRSPGAGAQRGAGPGSLSPRAQATPKEQRPDGYAAGPVALSGSFQQKPGSTSSLTFPRKGTQEYTCISQENKQLLVCWK